MSADGRKHPRRLPLPIRRAPAVPSNRGSSFSLVTPPSHYARAAAARSRKSPRRYSFPPGRLRGQRLGAVAPVAAQAPYPLAPSFALIARGLLLSW
jgi:hypothetical protein